jgi:branched-chain amino acid transport system ATP-binding protein
VDFALERGELRAVIGPNGAGKTVFLHLLSGVLAPTAGRIVLDGVDVSRRSVVERVRLGIARSFQITSLFPNLTVADNARLAAQPRACTLALWHGAAVRREVERRVAELLDQVGLGSAADAYPSELSHGDGRHLEIALALASNPRVLLLDEPTAGMSLAETGRTVALIRALNRDRGVTTVIVEHDMRVIRELATRVTVLDHGRVLAEGTPRDVGADPRVQTAYLGRRRHVAGL